MDTVSQKTIGIFSKLGMPGGSENRTVQLANAFVKNMPTYIFAEKRFSDKLKPQLDPRIMLRENTVSNKRYQYELCGVNILLVINSDSYSFCKTSYWDGTQGKHHKNNIDISQIESLGFLFNYVVGPAQWLVDLQKINPRIKIITTSQWFTKNIETEDKFKKLRKSNIPTMSISSPVSLEYAQPKITSGKIRINRHSMGFAYKHDQENLIIVKELCKRFGDKISFHWVGVPSQVRDINSDDKDARVPYKSVLYDHPQMKISKEYTVPIPQFLRETDIMFFYISRHRKEPWPRTIAEAMMAGCCCVTNNAHGMAEQIKSGENGFLFDSANQAIEQLSQLIENKEKIVEMGQNAQQFAKENFLDEVICEKTLKFLC